MIRILIADDHPVVRQGLLKILESQPDMAVAGEAASAAETLALAHEGRHDLVILDLSMPGRSGLETLEQLRLSHPNLPVLIFTFMPEDQYGPRAFRAGAAGFVGKQAPAQTLLDAIRRVASGRKFVSESLAETLAQHLAQGNGETPHDRLSSRELHVLRLLGAGESVAEIARQLSLSPKTISTYVARIREKMGMRSRMELVAYAVRKGLTD